MPEFPVTDLSVPASPGPALHPEPGYLHVIVRGCNIGDMRAVAMAAGRRLYGPDAPLSVVRIGAFRCTAGTRSPDPGEPGSGSEFSTEITVHCAELPEGFQP